VVQDWGGVLGLTLPMENAGALRAPAAHEHLRSPPAIPPLSPGFIAWRSYSKKNPDLAVGKLLARACPHLSEAEAAAYDAPFPDARYKAGVRRFPPMVPEHYDDPAPRSPGRRETSCTDAWSGESFMAIGAADPVLGLDVMRQLQRWIRGCHEPLVIENGGHFLQEWGDEVARWFLSQT
jgi:pimeloyl-ACP methyl ester carboxylesterase